MDRDKAQDRFEARKYKNNKPSAGPRVRLSPRPSAGVWPLLVSRPPSAAAPRARRHGCEPASGPLGPSVGGAHFSRQKHQSKRSGGRDDAAEPHLFEQGDELVSLGAQDLRVVLNVSHAPFNVQQGVLQLVSFPHHVDELPLEKASLEREQRGCKSLLEI